MKTMSRTETSLRAEGGSHKAAEDPLAELREQQTVFLRRLSQLLKDYRGQYVALRRGRVVGHGPDDEALARRMFSRFGDVVLLIARVEEEPSVYEIPSPEAVR